VTSRVGLFCAAGLLAGGVFCVRADPSQVPAAIPGPRLGAGASITGAFEGWYYNEDGSRTFLVGYYNRNWTAGTRHPDRAQQPDRAGRSRHGAADAFPHRPPVGHVHHRRAEGFQAEDKFVWTIVANGQTTQIPFRLHPDYVMSPFKEIAVGNTPPVIRFEQAGKGLQGPRATLATAPEQTATVSAPLTLTAWINDDLKYTSGTSAPPSASRAPVTVRWSKYRGPGAVTFDKPRPAVEKVDAGEGAFSGRAITTAKFAAAGDYVLHLIANDYSGDGGGGFGCCWTTAQVKVAVKP
jgi:hypothetical protein